MAKILKPQPGAQERFLASPASIILYGGAAGSGKTHAELLYPLRYKNVRGFGAVIFRKNANQIDNEGGLWDNARDMYSGIPGAQIRRGEKAWTFHDKNGEQLSRISFRHIERDEEVLNYHGSQICGIEYDELCMFSEYVFFYMLSRNRSMCGVRPYVIGTCNPDADSWVAKFIEWWIDQDTGYPIKERSGKIRWMMRRDDQIYWADTKQELIDQFNLVTPEELEEPRSVTFIAATIYDNQALLKANPQYLANLKAMPTIERERLLMGNWKIKPSAGLYFKREQLGNILQFVPDDVVQWVRCWDLAATEKDDKNDPAYTAGVLMGKRKNGRYIVADVINKALSASDVRNIIRLTAQADKARWKVVRIRLPQDPGQAGKDQAQSYIKFLSGYDVTAVLESGSKESRATPMAAQWQASNFDLVYGDWNDAYLNQLEGFPDMKLKDMVDASANAFAELELRSQFNLSNFF